MGYSPQSLKESGRTERLTLPFSPVVTLRGTGRSTLLSWMRDLGPYSSLSPVSEKRLSFPLQGQPFTSDHFEKYLFIYLVALGSSMPIVGSFVVARGYRLTEINLSLFCKIFPRVIPVVSFY